MFNYEFLSRVVLSLLLMLFSLRSLVDGGIDTPMEFVAFSIALPLSSVFFISIFRKNSGAVQSFIFPALFPFFALVFVTFLIVYNLSHQALEMSLAAIVAIALGLAFSFIVAFGAVGACAVIITLIVISSVGGVFLSAATLTFAGAAALGLGFDLPYAVIYAGLFVAALFVALSTTFTIGGGVYVCRTYQYYSRRSSPRGIIWPCGEILAVLLLAYWLGVR